MWVLLCSARLARLLRAGLIWQGWQACFTWPALRPETFVRAHAHLSGIHLLPCPQGLLARALAAPHAPASVHHG